LTADLGNTMLYPALATGGTLHIISEDRATDPEALGAYFRHHQPDCLKIVPSHLATLLMGIAPAEVLPQKRLVVGGEACPWHLVEKVQALRPACKVINHYGPTETTVGVTTHQMEATKRASSNSLGVPIGRPLSNSQIYLLDEHKNPVPLGVAGEMYIGGRGLARGYRDDPELTAEKFLPHPYSDQPGARLYKTGDRARFQPDGTIEFLGRIDHQVKLRGFRIELGEIESVLATHLQVPVVVGLYGDEAVGTQRLVAYIGGEGRALPSVAEIKIFLKKTLPDYMIPANLVVLESLPVLPNGKVDRHALPDPEGVTDRETEFLAPRNLTEEIIASIWADVLQRERVSLHDNFFDLGGHSLLATQVVLRMRDAFEVNMKLGYFFEAPTIAGMAESIETLQWKTKAPLRVGETSSPDRKKGTI
jgi:acyl-coenzyme A synthetase/AMP-(fatty) acid ligase